MSTTSAIVFLALASSVALSLVACSSGDVPVGSQDQELKKKKDRGTTGDGKTCSWDDTVSSTPSGAVSSSSSTGGAYKVGDTFPSLDGCNSCSCTVGGIACTLRACAPKACSAEAKLCPDGSSVGRTGPNCDFSPCPGEQACTEEAKLCPDGSSVGRTGPNCQFAPCPTPKVCTMEAKQCPDGSYVARSGPNCDFTPCP